MPQFSIIVLPGRGTGTSVASLRRQTVGRPKILICAGTRPVADEVRDAIESATGDYIGFLGADDQLLTHTLEWAAAQIADGVDLIYTDEDRIDANGSIGNPFFKPDWSPDRLLGHNYVRRLALIRRSTLAAIGGVRVEFGAAWEYDLILRVAATAREVRHVKEIGYRAGPTSPPSFVPEAAETRRALEDHLAQLAVPAIPQLDAAHGVFQLRPNLTATPLVSIVIPAGGAIRRLDGATVSLISNCVHSIVEKSTYPNYEIIVVADRHAEAGIRASLATVGDGRLHVIPYDAPFNFARKINVGCAYAGGDYYVLLNDDTAVIAPDWLESMLVFATQPDIGAVGAMLRNADSRYQHVGVVIVSGNPGHPFAGFPKDYPGYFDNVLVPCDYLAVTGACLMTPRNVFEAVGGLSPKFPLNYNDVDFCLKLRDRGQRVVYAPAVELFHFESSSRGEPQVADEELERLYMRWASQLNPDPYFSPHFLSAAEFLTLVIPEGQTARDLGVGVGSNLPPRLAR